MTILRTQKEKCSVLNFVRAYYNTIRIEHIAQRTRIFPLVRENISWNRQAFADEGPRNRPNVLNLIENLFLSFKIKSEKFC